MKKIVKANLNTDIIINFLKENNLSKTAFCKKYNYSISSLNNILKENVNINLTAALKLVRILKIELKDLFKN